MNWSKCVDIFYIDKNVINTFLDYAFFKRKSYGLECK